MMRRSKGIWRKQRIWERISEELAGFFYAQPKEYTHEGHDYKPLIKPRFCIRLRSEAYKTLAKREVGAILNRKHIHKYVEDQNRETSVAARLLKPQ